MSSVGKCLLRTQDCFLIDSHRDTDFRIFYAIFNVRYRSFALVVENHAHKRY